MSISREDWFCLNSSKISYIDTYIGIIHVKPFFQGKFQRYLAVKCNLFVNLAVSPFKSLINLNVKISLVKFLFVKFD